MCHIDTPPGSKDSIFFAKYSGGGISLFRSKEGSTDRNRLLQIATLFLVAVFFLGIGSSKSYAQGKKTDNEVLDTYEICLPDCYNDKWIDYPGQYTVTIGSCKFKVEFAYRKACGMYCDIAIKSIKNYSGIQTNPHCATMDIQTVYDIVSVNLLRFAIANLNPPLDCGPFDVDQCSTYWRVASSSCWQYIPNFPNGNYPPWADNPSAAQGEAAFWHGTYTTCNLNACCFSTYTVCIDGVGNVIVTRTSQVQTGPCPPDMPRCRPSCGG